MQLIAVVCFYGESIIEKECLMMLLLFDRHRIRNTTLGFSDPCFPHWMWFNFFSVLVCPHAPLVTRLLPVAPVQLRVLPPTSHHSPPREWTESLKENCRKCSCQFSWRRYKKDHCFTLGLPTEGRKAKVLFNFRISNSKRHCDKGLDKGRTTLYSIPNSSKGKHCLR